MLDKEMYKKPGDLIRSEEWNTLVDESIELRKYIEQMTRAITLTRLESPSGSSYNLSGDVPEDFNYGIDVMGLITKQFFIGIENVGETCRFGIHDFADVIYYWSGAAKGDKLALKITLEYTDNSTHTSKDLFIHEWTKLRPRGDNNPYYEYILSPNQRLMYRYALENPNPEKPIRFIIFEDINNACALRIGNVLHYVTRIRQLQKI
jgi:hypothetical protein